MQAGSALQTLGSRIRTERLNLNLTQQNLAECCNVSLRTYQTFEQTGFGSTRTLVNALIALGQGSVLFQILEKKSDYRSVEEFKRAKQPVRKRAS